MLPPRAALAAISLAATACAGSPYDRAWLSRDLVRRAGAPSRTERGDTAPGLPPGVSLAAMTPADAVATALWNNPAFNAELANLGVARADLAEAGLLPNPTLALLLPLGPRQIEAWIAWPFEALWQLPRRVAAAQRETARVGEALVQTGLDLARDVRVAHADALLARERATLRAEAAEALSGLRALTEARLRAGDASEPEVAAARAEEAASQELAVRAGAEREVAEARLRLILGLGDLGGAVTPVAGELDDDLPDALDALVALGLASRPDVRAAELAVEAAGARLGWERTRVVGLLARADLFGPAPGADGVTGRAGAQVTLPIFNANQGGVGRAEAEIERATWRLALARQQVAAEVATARAQATQARRARRIWRDAALPAAEDALRGARAAFAAGDTSWIAVLDATRRALDARVRAAELAAEQRRADAQLERAVGGRRERR